MFRLLKVVFIFSLKMAFKSRKVADYLNDKVVLDFTFMVPCIANVFSHINNKMQLYKNYLFL
jgi:hypothetical protein